MTRIYMFTRIGQLIVGFALGLVAIIATARIIDYFEVLSSNSGIAISYEDIQLTFSTLDIHLGYVRVIPLGWILAVSPFLSMALYFLRSSRGAFSMMKDKIRRGILMQRWLIRMAWSTPLVVLVGLLFGVTSLPVLTSIGALNVLSHVFLIEMDRSSINLPYVDWVPLMLSMLMFISTIIVIVYVGFDSVQLYILPQATRFVLIGYFLVHWIFYVNAIMHYGGYGRWKNPEYSDNAFSLNDVTVHLAMMILIFSLLDSLTQ